MCISWLKGKPLDSSGAAITYALVNSSPSFPFTLTATGLVYGHAPTLYANTVYQFTVSATSVNGTASQTMDIIAEPVTIGSLLYWNSDSNCGTIADGAYVTLDVSAASKRGLINYSVVGGILPRGLILNRQSGLISGFAEYQTRDRSYLFDIGASDGIQTITRTFSVTIVRSTQYQYLGMSIPVEGSLKDIYFQYIGTTINSTWVPYSSTTPQSVLYTPFVQLIQGLNYAIDDPAAAVHFANLSLNTTELMIGATTNVNVCNAGNFCVRAERYDFASFHNINYLIFLDYKFRQPILDFYILSIFISFYFYQAFCRNIDNVFRITKNHSST